MLPTILNNSAGSTGSTSAPEASSGWDFSNPVNISGTPQTFTISGLESTGTDYYKDFEFVVRNLQHVNTGNTTLRIIVDGVEITTGYSTNYTRLVPSSNITTGTIPSYSSCVLTESSSSQEPLYGIITTRVFDAGTIGIFSNLYADNNRTYQSWTELVGVDATKISGIKLTTSGLYFNAGAFKFRRK